MFQSPSFGPVTLDTMRTTILQFLIEEKTEEYQIIIGTDSQPHNGSGVDFVTAVVVHRKGHGGIYFWKRVVHKKKYVLRQRMYEEAGMSMETAEILLSLFEKDGITKYNLEIHIDIGQFGDTKQMIAEIVGMVRGSGYRVKIKPDSYGASKVADKYT